MVTGKDGCLKDPTKIQNGQTFDTIHTMKYFQDHGSFFSYKNGKKTILIQSYDIWFSKAAFSNIV